MLSKKYIFLKNKISYCKTLFSQNSWCNCETAIFKPHLIRKLFSLIYLWLGWKVYCEIRNINKAFAIKKSKISRLSPLMYAESDSVANRAFFASPTGDFISLLFGVTVWLNRFFALDEPVWERPDWIVFVNIFYCATLDRGLKLSLG